MSTWQNVAKELDELFVAVAEAREKLVAVPEEAADVARELSKLLSRQVTKLVTAASASASSDEEPPAKKKDVVSQTPPKAEAPDDPNNGSAELPFPPANCDPVRY